MKMEKKRKQEELKDSDDDLNSSKIPLSVSKALCSSFYYESVEKEFSCLPVKQFRISVENKRIIKRIMNPKRDKVILNSLEQTRKQDISKISSKVSKYRHENPNSTDKKQSIQRKIISDHKKKNHYSSKKQSDKKYQQRHRLKIQNQRMGNRIVNAKPFFSFHHPSRTRKADIRKIVNDGVKVFFAQSNKIQKQKKASSHAEPNLRSFYGCGPTIIVLKKIKIHKNPHVKPDDLISIEMAIQSNKKQKGKYWTQSIRYAILQEMQIKFAVRIRDIGQFVPIRFWKVKEVDLQELGIVDIDFTQYLMNQAGEKQIEDIDGIFSRKERNYQGKSRCIFERSLNSRMRGSKVGCVQGQISLQYKIYSKKYR